jgi:hypothetical protein
MRRIWAYTVPLLLATVLTTFTALLICELRGISHVALLYIQSFILLLTTVMVMTLWMHCLEVRGSRFAKGVLMGCSVSVWGVVFLGYLRVVVIWMAESRSGRRSRGYGTF